MKTAVLKHGQHMQSLREFYDRVVQEPIPIRFWELLEELPSFSDVSSGAGVSAEIGPTSLGSRIRHVDRTSREIHAVPNAQSHNLNAPLSTRAALGGSDA